jgi:type IX secretion system PorP/SprF family membrane protein
MILVKKTKMFLVGLILSSTLMVNAQQEPMYTHYMYNTLAVNPAYAGSRDALSMLALGRFQWVGLEGAPMSQTFQVHSPIYAGLTGGFSVNNDMIGPVSSTSANLDLAYQFRFGEHSRLSIGMRGTLNFFNNRLTSLQLVEQNDPLFNTDYNITFGNVGAGIYYQHTKFYVGFGVPNLVEHRLNSTLALSTEKRHYYMMAGGYFKIGRTVDIKPSALVKVVGGAPIQADVSVEFIFQRKISVGVFGRTFDGVGLLLGYNVMPNFKIGYSFDWPVTELMNAGQYGSHEVLLRYDLSWGKYSKVNNPRYF